MLTSFSFFHLGKDFMAMSFIFSLSCKRRQVHDDGDLLTKNNLGNNICEFISPIYEYMKYLMGGFSKITVHHRPCVMELPTKVALVAVLRTAFCRLMVLLMFCSIYPWISYVVPVATVIQLPVYFVLHHGCWTRVVLTCIENLSVYMCIRSAYHAWRGQLEIAPLNSWAPTAIPLFPNWSLLLFASCRCRVIDLCAGCAPNKALPIRKSMFMPVFILLLGILELIGGSLKTFRFCKCCILGHIIQRHRSQSRFGCRVTGHYKS